MSSLATGILFRPMSNKRKKPRRKRPGPPRPAGATVRPPSGPETEPAKTERRAAARERREAQLRVRQARQRRRQLRQLGIVTLVVILLGSLIAWRVMDSQRKNREAAKIAAAAKCGAVKKTEGTGTQQHLPQGGVTTYDQSPPTHGQHAASPLRAGVYDAPFTEGPNAASPSLYESVHSLEHGYIIVWHNGLNEAELEKLTDEFGKERKVIVVPYPQLKNGKMAMTAWARTQTCQTADPAAVRSFVRRFREETAPEPTAP